MESAVLRIVRKFSAFVPENQVLTDLIESLQKGETDLKTCIQVLRNIRNDIYDKNDEKDQRKINKFNDQLKPLLNIQKLEAKQNKDCTSINFSGWYNTKNCIIDEIDDEEGEEEVTGKLDFEQLISRSLCIANYEKRMKNPPIYDICFLADYYLELDRARGEIWNTDFTYAMDSNDKKYLIQSEEAAKLRLRKIFPIVEFMNFDKYRAAGGAILNAIRKRDSGESTYDGDLDLFIVTGPFSDNTTIATKEHMAYEIYVSLLKEIETILDQHFREQYRTIFVKNKDCTTIFLLGVVTDKEETVPKKMKIQIIHRIHEYDSQIITAFDLPPCQIMYDGSSFSATQAAMISILTNFISIDVTRMCTNSPHRIYKYYNRREFSLIFPGMSRKALMDKFKANYEDAHLTGKESILFQTKEEKEFISLSTIGRWNYERMTEVGKILDDHYMLEYHLTSSTCNNDYFSVDDVTELDDVFKTNTRFLLKDLPIMLTATDVNELLKEPIGTISKEIIIDFGLDSTKLDETKRIFGDFAEKAWLAKFNKDKEAYEMFQDMRFKELEEKARVIFKELETISWRIYCPDDGNSKAFYPINVTAREFYGKLYNGYTCTSDWSAKMQIIRAYKNKYEEKDCALVQILSKDILKLIFKHVDYLNYNVQIFI